MISRDKETFFSVCIFVVVIIPYSDLGVSKKTKKSSKPRKKNQKNRTEKKTDYFFCKNFQFGLVSVYKTGNRQNPNRTEPVRFKG
jgi:hypothetical protein